METAKLKEEIKLHILDLGEVTQFLNDVKYSVGKEEEYLQQFIEIDGEEIKVSDYFTKAELLEIEKEIEELANEDNPRFLSQVA